MGDLQSDPAAIVQALELLTEPGQVVELRILNARKGTTGYTENLTGYFDRDHLAELARASATVMATGYYFTLNPVNPDLQARAFNRLKKAEKGDSTADKDIVHRINLLIDLDVDRPTGISSTDEEKAAAWAKLTVVRDYLTAQGWPEPMVIDSGNGYHLVYRIGLPTDDADTVKRCLLALGKMFDDPAGTRPAVHIDKGVFNPARISKLPETPVRKGDNTPTRPHRMARLVSAPQVLETVPTDLLEALAGPVETKPTSKATSGTTFDLATWMGKHFPDATGPSTAGFYEITCPWRPEDGRSAFIGKLSDGGLTAGCQHATCPGSKTTGKHWRELREMVDPPSDNNGGAYLDDPGGDLWEGTQEQEWVHPTMPLAPTVAKAGKSTRRLDSIRWSDLRGKPVPPVRYDLEPFFPTIPFGVLGAGSGHGKSILIVQVAVGKATGLPVLGYPIGAVGSVGIVALEDDKNVLHRRIAAAVDSYGPMFTEEHHRLLDVNLRTLVRARSPLAYLTPELLDMALAGLVGEIGEEMATCEAPPAMVFLDTLNAVHEGEENSATETRPLVAAIWGLNARLSCSVWALHHLTKTGTSRNAPMFTDRMDPTLVRGSGAIVGSSRGTVQFGWIYPKEASKVGLEPDGATKHYAVMGLTKVNDGPPSPWILLEHSANAGLWVVVPNGAAILAKLKGAEAVVKASLADLVLMAIHEAGVAGQPFDKKEVAARLFGDNKDPSSNLRTYMNRLLTDKLILSTKGGLTGPGMRRVRELLDTEDDPNAA